MEAPMRSVSVLTMLGLLASPAWAQLDKLAAPPGSLFAYVPVPAFDREGKPVMKAENGERLQDGFCLFWKPGWLTRNDRVPITVGQVWWTGVSYTVEPRAREITVYRVWGPDAAALPEGGWRRVTSGTNGYQGKGVTAPMFEAPKP